MQISVARAADHADVRRGGEDFVETERALFKHYRRLSQVSTRRSSEVGFREAEGRRTSQERDEEDKVSHVEVSKLRQLAQLGRQPFELIVVDLEHRLEVRSYDPLYLNFVLRAARAVSAGRFLMAAT